jgi:hypothetical protein
MRPVRAVTFDFVDSGIDPSTVQPVTSTPLPDQQPTGLDARLARIETLLQQLVEQRTVKEWYSTAEVAALMERAEFTIREWCRLGRVHAEKRLTGWGRSREWMISHEELTRLRNEGLLPEPKSVARSR